MPPSAADHGAWSASQPATEQSSSTTAEQGGGRSGSHVDVSCCRRRHVLPHRRQVERGRSLHLGGDVLELHSLHDRYRQKYGLSKHEFPLLELNPIRWNAPFRAYK